jgi:hypothetical protein
VFSRFIKASLRANNSTGSQNITFLEIFFQICNCQNQIKRIALTAIYSKNIYDFWILSIIFFGFIKKNESSQDVRA